MSLCSISVCLTSPLSFLICWLNSLPSRHRKSSPGTMMPHLVAMARAVLMLSPVTMRTVMPARWHLEIASGTWNNNSSDVSESGKTRRLTLPDSELLDGTHSTVKSSDCKFSRACYITASYFIHTLKSERTSKVQKGCSQFLLQNNNIRKEEK